MSPEEITSMLKQVRGGKLSVEDAVERLRTLPYEDLGYAKIDHHRSLRQGFPEVVFARGKDPEQVKGIVSRMLRNQHNILVTRGDRDLYELLRPLDPKVEFHALSGAISIRKERKIRGKGTVLVVCAGTSDIPVAEEALVTATSWGTAPIPFTTWGWREFIACWVKASICARRTSSFAWRAWKERFPAWWQEWWACP